MRIVVMSDSHGALHTLRRIISDNRREAEAFIFLGDGLAEFDLLRPEYPECAFYAVRGNCDFRAFDADRELWLSFDGYDFLVCHGDRYGVKYGLDAIEQEGRLRQADVVLYGHTHNARIDYLDGIYYLCPGSLADSRYTPCGYLRIDITDAGIVPVQVNL